MASVFQEELTFEDIESSVSRIRDRISPTPLKKSLFLSKELGINIFFKNEFTLPTGSFKERGARNSLKLLKEKGTKGAIAASAGNHALAMAYHGFDLGIPVTVVMPVIAPIMKVSRCRMYNAEIVIYGNNIAESKEYALQLAKERSLDYINGYNQHSILAGAGTVGIEMVEQMREKNTQIDAVIVPVGGGGLIAGISTAVKTLSPTTVVYGAESESCPSFHESLRAGKLVKVPLQSTIADGLAVPEIGDLSFETAKKWVDHSVVVSEDMIALSILRLVEWEKAVVEGAGATGLAACMSPQLVNTLKGKNVVIPLCGGNIDTTILGRCIERGLAADGRLIKFKVTVTDKPGGLKQLTTYLADSGASIKDIFHERAWVQKDIFSVEIKVVAETRDRAHGTELRGILEDKYGKLSLIHI